MGTPLAPFEFQNAENESPENSFIKKNGGKSIYYSLFDFFYKKKILRVKYEQNTDGRINNYLKKGFYKMPINCKEFADRINKELYLNDDQKIHNNCIIYKVTNTIKDHVNKLCNNDLHKYLDELSKFYQSNIYLACIKISKNLSYDSDEESYANHYHIDNNRFTLFKLFIPLLDISDDDGPTHIISYENKKKFIKETGYISRNQKKLKETDSNIIFKNIAKKGEILVCNTPRCFHRAGVPKKNNSRTLMNLSFVAYPKKYENNKYLDFYANKEFSKPLNYNLVNYFTKSRNILDMISLFSKYKNFAKNDYNK